MLFGEIAPNIRKQETLAFASWHLLHTKKEVPSPTTTALYSTFIECGVFTRGEGSPALHSVSLLLGRYGFCDGGSREP